MKKNEKLILFDYDGTIVDSAPMIVNGALEAFKKCGIPEPDPEKVRENIGKPLAVALKEYMPKGYNVSAKKISDAYKNWYAEQGKLGLQNEPLFNGMKELIQNFKKRKQLYLGVATNKSRIALNNGLIKHNLINLFDITLTTDENNPKPEPDMALYAMKKLNINRESTIMIGDTINDILMAVNSKINSIGVAWGYNDVKTLKSAGATIIVSDAKELEQYLEHNFL